MVSPVLAQAILGQRAPDIVGSFEAGREKTRQADIKKLTGGAVAGEKGALQRLTKLDPLIGLQIGESIAARDANDIENFIKASEIGESLLASNNVQGFITFANNRVNSIQARGGDSTQTEKLLKLASTNPAAALQELKAFNQSLTGSEALSDVQSSDILPDGTTIQVLKDGNTRVTGADGRELSGRARVEAIRTAREFGVKITGRGAEARAGAGKIKQSIKKAGEAFDKLPGISKSIQSIDSAIAALDEGASTGAIRSKLPSVRAASVKLDQVMNQMGLDVVGASTFGALSESELKFALDTALPVKLSPSELRQWLIEKRDVQNKLRDGVENVAIELMKGKTIADLVQESRAIRQSLVFNPQTGTLEPK